MELKFDQYFRTAERERELFKFKFFFNMDSIEVFFFVKRLQADVVAYRKHLYVFKCEKKKIKA